VTRLAGPPGPTFRFELRPTLMHATVRGVFPPERASALRPLAALAARDAFAPAMAAYRRELASWEHRLIHGEPTAREPVGILNMGRR
jgi:hypothetical protein